MVYGVITMKTPELLTKPAHGFDPEASLKSQQISVPHFIIGGAMKCATTSLHHLLNRHPSIFIPAPELKLFAVDDFVEQPAFFWDGRNWTDRNVDLEWQTYQEWYLSFFKGAHDKITGDDSPAYLASSLAPKRIASCRPDAKLIFLIRHPVERAYSHYWHWVKNGMAHGSFEDTLRFQNSAILTRGFYKEQLTRYFHLFPREQILILFFEDFIKNTEACVRRAIEFLGQNQAEFRMPDDRHSNPAKVPRYPQLKCIENWLLSEGFGTEYQKFLPGSTRPETSSLVWPKRLIRRLARAINPMEIRRPTPMSSATYNFLMAVYQRHNRGLSSILEVDPADYWSGWPRGL